MAKEYQEVSHAEEEQPLTSSAASSLDGRDERWAAWKSETGPRTITQRLERRIGPNWAWMAHGVLLSISMTFFALSFCLRSAKHEAMPPTTWSPAASAIKYEIQHFDLPPMPGGPYVGKGREVDKAWEYITDDIGDTMVSREEMIKMGLDPEGALEITDPATGRPGFRVAVEMFHQLHCLNLLRQNNYQAHYRPLGGDTAAPSHDLHGHLDHCIDALRQFVMCQGDVNVFAFRFPFGDGDPWPDYSTPHTCRNYEGIRRWAVDHTVARVPDEPEH